MASVALKRVLRVAVGLHVALYRASGGRLANRIANLPVLLITTTGRKSGKPHTNPVVYLKEGQDYLVTASAGGMSWHPGWYFNLRHVPEARIQVGGKAFDATAEIIESEERNRLYEQFKTASVNFIKYEKNAGRVIPVIRLTPVEITG